MARETICRTASSNSSGDFPPPSLMHERKINPLISEELDDFESAQDFVVCLVGKIFKAIVTSALAIAPRFAFALGDDAASFTDDLTPPLTRFLDESRSTGGFVVKNDFVSAAVRAPKTDANFIEINLKHAAESAMQSISKRFSRL
jgi:hypothetical protein